MAVSRALAQGAVDYVSKPLDEIELPQKRLASIVDQRRQASLVAQMARDLSKMAAGDDGDEHLI